jgi:hypothetical protein
MLVEPALLLTIRVTAYDPVAEKEWLGFRAVLVAPSLKSHSQEVGLPVVVSVN